MGAIAMIVTHAGWLMAVPAEAAEVECANNQRRPISRSGASRSFIETHCGSLWALKGASLGSGIHRHVANWTEAAS